jgi:hypothetical protein
LNGCSGRLQAGPSELQPNPGTSTDWSAQICRHSRSTLRRISLLRSRTLGTTVAWSWRVCAHAWGVTGMCRAVALATSLSAVSEVADGRGPHGGSAALLRWAAPAAEAGAGCANPKRVLAVGAKRRRNAETAPRKRSGHDAVCSVASRDTGTGGTRPKQRSVHRPEECGRCRIPSGLGSNRKRLVKTGQWKRAASDGERRQVGNWGTSH